MKRKVIVPLIFVFIISFASSVGANVVNGGFETSVNLTGSVPNDFGYWRGDVSQIVAASDGITPYEGLQMAHFIYASPVGATPSGASELWQIVDISSFKDLIPSGSVTTSASAYFNRVTGDNQTDTLFAVRLAAYSGDPSTLLSQWNNQTQLAFNEGLIFTDNDPATWERASVDLVLPGNTDFLVIHISSREDKYNDSSGPEFDGHFADAVSLTIRSVSITRQFEDNFNGVAIDPAKWNTAIATDGKRWCSETIQSIGTSPGNWEDEFCHAYNFADELPHGVITVENGQASFSSGPNRTFPYIWTGPPSRSSPFPTTEDFIFEVRMKYDSITSSGSGLRVLFWENSEPEGNNPPIPSDQVAFRLWADNAGLRTSTLGQVKYLYSQPYAFHDYRLECIDGQYSLYVDGVLTSGPIASDLRPNAIWVGNPVFTHWIEANWSDFTIDYIRVTVPQVEVPPNYQFSVEEGSQQQYLIDLINYDNAEHSATVEILNPFPDLHIELESENSVNLSPRETKAIPITVDASSASVGTYEVQVQIIIDGVNILFSNLRIYVTEQNNVNLPDLVLSAQDISFSSLNPNPGDSVTLTAKVHNDGSLTAPSISVCFYDFDNILDCQTINSSVPGSMQSVSVYVDSIESGTHLIRALVDPSNNVLELDETNNEAGQLLHVGTVPEMTGNILVTGSLPSTVYANSLFWVTGHAVYEIYVNGQRNTDYEVKGGSVQVTIMGENGKEWVYPNIFTNTAGDFSKLLRAPSDLGTYDIAMTVTDKTFTGKRQLFFEVVAAPEPSAPPPPPPSPPTGPGSGYWSYSGGGSGTYTWTWDPSVYDLPPEEDLYVHSKDIYFSKDNPALGEEITILANIHYWSSSTDTSAQNVPINFYVTYPGYFERMKIGEITIETISVGAPHFGSQSLFVSWKNTAVGIYIVEVEIDPSYQEENVLNNSATRAIIVGEPWPGYGVVSGHVTDPWGVGFESAQILLYDNNGNELAQAYTDEKGGYQFNDLPPNLYQVKILTPAGYSVDLEMKTITVFENSISIVDFTLIWVDNEGPISSNLMAVPNPLPVNSQVSFAAIVDDSNTGNSNISLAEYTMNGGLDWYDMPAADAFDSPTEGAATAFMTPSVAGVYDLCVRGRDAADNVGPEECTLLVIYDPDGGFVTGGGWIDSPEGAYTADPSLTGKATFGFVSKYKKGADIPTGNTEFQFHAGDLNFHSSSYEWLVVTGSNYARFKGSGTINGEGDYKFMLWAGDDDPDTFRIKIWEEDESGTEVVTYDNGMDQAISRGSIKIHNK